MTIQAGLLLFLGLGMLTASGCDSLGQRQVLAGAAAYGPAAGRTTAAPVTNSSSKSQAARTWRDPDLEGQVEVDVDDTEDDIRDREFAVNDDFGTIPAVTPAPASTRRVWEMDGMASDGAPRAQQVWEMEGMGSDGAPRAQQVWEMEGMGSDGAPLADSTLDES